MAMITNALLAIFSAFAFIQLKKQDDKAIAWWSYFFLTFGLSTFCSIFGHGFFNYTGVVGKFPCWFFGAIANVCAAKAMISFQMYSNPMKFSSTFIYLKSFLLLCAAFFYKSFIFITIDAVITYLMYTGFFGVLLYNRGLKSMRFMIIGVIILLPSIFIFLLKLNPHRWLNKDDLSHLLMLGCISCFYLGANHWGWTIQEE